MLSTTELYLVLRARDEASRVLRSFSGNLKNMDKEQQASIQRTMAHGQALATAGVAVASAGVLALGVMSQMTDSAVAYNDEVSRTLTQVDKVHVSFQNLWDMGMKVGRDVPVAFDQIQGSLYDIFSSIDVNGPGAALILDTIARAAVGGGASMQVAGRAIIAIMNAYHQPVKDAAKDSDILFQLVRKGVGTYSQFTEVIGRAIPSSARAGQNIQTLAGMMAFLTRNGLSAANAATSSARALDALSNPGTVNNMKAFNVQIYDSKGKMLPLLTVIGNMKTAMKGMNDQQKSAALQQMFKGSGGTIQAMRFFNSAMKDNSGLLKEMVGDMNNAGGAAAQAYKVMANTPQAQIQLMKNRYQEMKITVGQQLIPVKLQLMQVLSKLLDWWLKLSPHMQHTIVMFASIAASAAVVIGILMSVVGVFMMLSSALEAIGIGLGVFSLIIVALVAVGIAAYEVYKHWAAIEAFGKQVWKDIWDAIKPVVDYITHDLVQAWQIVSQAFTNFWNYVYPLVKKNVDIIINALQVFVRAWQAVSGELVDFWNFVYPLVSKSVASIVKAVQDFFSQISSAIKTFLGNFQGASEAIGHIFNAISDVVRDVLWPIFKFIFDAIMSEIKDAVWPTIKFLFDSIEAIIRDVFWPIIKFAIRILAVDFVAAFEILVPIVTGVFKVLAAIITTALNIIGDIIAIAINLINGNWGKAWHKFLQLLVDIFAGAFNIVKTAFLAIIGIIDGWVGAVIHWFEHLYHELIGGSIIPDLINGIVTWFEGLPGKVLKFIENLVVLIVDKINELPGDILRGLGDLSTLLFSVGQDIVNGLINGIGSIAADAANAAANLAKGLLHAAKNAVGAKSPSKAFHDLGVDIVQGLIIGIRESQVTGLTSTIEARINQMLKAASSVAYSHVQGASSIYNALAKENQQFLTLVRQRASVTTQLAAANRALAAQQKLWAGMKATVSQSIAGSFDITSQTGDITTVLSNLRSKLQAAKDFGNNLTKLTKEGLNRTLLQQLAQAGPDAAGPAVQALLSGTQGDISTVNTLYHQLSVQSSITGTQIANDLYGAGVAAAKGLVSGLQKEKVNIAKEMTDIANTMVAAIKRALGIKSPSLVFHDVGMMIGRGLAAGMRDSISIVSAASTDMMKATLPASYNYPNRLVRPTHSWQGSGGGGTQNIVFQQGAIVTQEINPVKHAADLGWELSRRVG